MRHFAFLDAVERDRLFHRAPETFDADADPGLLAVALGASLYSPATRPQLAEDIVRRSAHGVTSVVVCLEDSVADHEVPGAQRNVVEQLRHLGELSADPPMIFVRVRSREQIPLVVAGLGEYARVLTGFVLPKFTAAEGEAALAAVARAGAELGHRLLVMPVLESPELIHAETRIAALLNIRRLLDDHREQILAVRLGATDLSAAYGLRRARDLTVWDVRVVADLIAGVVNVFGRTDGGEYVITGPVWEYFSGRERLFKPQLRETPFTAHAERKLRARLIARDLDGLVREIALDQANGLLGKTVIHPSHVPVVHALSVLSHEEFADAADVLGTAATGGASASAYGNKMNESKPHTAWARRTLLRGRVFGVAAPGVSFVDLLAASLPR